MKKQLIILSALSVLGSPWALANNDIVTTALPPAPQTELIIDLSGTAEPSSTQDDIRAALEEARADVIRVYQHIQHVDLRDVDKYDKEIAKLLPNSQDRLPGTSRKILKAVSENTYRFTGFDNIRYFENGARGPKGRVDSVPYKEGKRKEFIIEKRYTETYNDTLFSVDYESAREIAPQVIEADLVLFAHESSFGHFFKRVTVVVDWKKNKTHGIEDVVRITKSGPEIRLSETDFRLKGSIADQKIILEDQATGITKVFPVTVGAIDARDGLVESMNFHVPESNRRNAKKAGKDSALQAEFQDFSNAALIKRSLWNTGTSWANTHERTYPHDYRGRPFMALVDMNFVDGNDFAKGYREVGIHYQITRKALERGFRSHGCVRVRDKDLYQIDAIVNFGPRDKVPAVFKRDLPQYADLNHPHTYNKNVAMVKYTDYNAALHRQGSRAERVLCKISPSEKGRKVRWNSDNKAYHTVIGNDCLTSTEKSTGVSSADVKAYWNGNGPRIRPYIVRAEHGPVAKAKEALSQYGYYYDVINAMSQRTRLETVDALQASSIGNFDNGRFDNGFDNEIDNQNTWWSTVTQPRVQPQPSRKKKKKKRSDYEGR